MKAASIPNLNRETTSFPNFFSLYQDVDHDDDMTLNERPNIDRDDNSEASETSPLNDILSLSLSPLVSSNEIGFLAASRSVMMFRCESEHTTSSVGSNQFSGNSRGARSEGTNPPQMDNYQQPQMSDSRILLQPLDQQRLFLDPSQSFSRSVAPQAQNMKELREIVPNGAKCSVDALLERTIKHMLFLQSVTKHADNLKQAGESKIINKDGGLLLKDNFEGGRKWAYEVGSQSMVCPIIVEDLNRPRQMLVEMLCEERGLFLEIADIIRGLGLTILKGVMETWNDKIWARFAVEANRDVTRMEIFVSLVCLLEQTTKNNAAASGNGIENDNVMIHQFFHQGTSIPATGQPCGLQ